MLTTLGLRVTYRIRRFWTDDSLALAVRPQESNRAIFSLPKKSLST